MRRSFAGGVMLAFCLWLLIFAAALRAQPPGEVTVEILAPDGDFVPVYDPSIDDTIPLVATTTPPTEGEYWWYSVSPKVQLFDFADGAVRVKGLEPSLWVGAEQVCVDFHWDPMWLPAHDNHFLTVFGVDLEADGVTEEMEDIAGTYVAVNNDDDDRDGVLDRDDGFDKDGIAGNADDKNSQENDLLQIEIKRVMSDDPQLSGP